MHRQPINTYFAMLLITLVAAGAAQLIVHLANATTFEIIETPSYAEYVR